MDELYTKMDLQVGACLVNYNLLGNLPVRGIFLLTCNNVFKIDIIL